MADFYSNCLIQALKAKIKHPFKVKITFIRPRLTECPYPCPHFMWSDGEYDYDFGVERYLKPTEVVWFKGYIRKRKLGFNQKYKELRIKKYLEGDKNNG